MDVAASCSERRDQGNGTGKMREHKGRRKRREGRGESGDTGGRQKYLFLRRAGTCKELQQLCSHCSNQSI